MAGQASKAQEAGQPQREESLMPYEIHTNTRGVVIRNNAPKVGSGIRQRNQFLKVIETASANHLQTFHYQHDSGPRARAN